MKQNDWKFVKEEDFGTQIVRVYMNRRKEKIVRKYFNEKCENSWNTRIFDNQGRHLISIVVQKTGDVWLLVMNDYSLIEEMIIGKTDPTKCFYPNDLNYE